MAQWRGHWQSESRLTMPFYASIASICFFAGCLLGWKVAFSIIFHLVDEGQLKVVLVPKERKDVS
jgi:hypothetical protein